MHVSVIVLCNSLVSMPVEVVQMKICIIGIPEAYGNSGT